MIFLEGALRKIGQLSDKMIDKTHQLSVRQQSQLIQINRSTLYYKPKEISSLI
jgi:putative transposase